MKDRTRHTRHTTFADNRKTRRKSRNSLKQDYRFHKKVCQQCREAPKPVNERIWTESEIQKRRCLDGQQVYLKMNQDLLTYDSQN